MGDPERYRKSEEVKHWQEHDPIGVFRAYLMGKKQATEKTLDALEAEALAEVEAAVAYAESSPEPAPEALFANVYVES